MTLLLLIGLTLGRFTHPSSACRPRMKQIAIAGNAESIDHNRSLSGSKNGITSRLGRDADDLISLPSSMSLLGFAFR